VSEFVLGQIFLKSQVMMKTGQCYCGSLKYEITEQAEAAFQCHCRECQYITGGNPNIVMVFSKDSFRYIKGNPKKFCKE
jgi:hypothetical protein